jgi:Zn-finger nucleic acid-binding protein
MIIRVDCNVIGNFLEGVVLRIRSSFVTTVEAMTCGRCNGTWMPEDYLNHSCFAGRVVQTEAYKDNNEGDGHGHD